MFEQLHGVCVCRLYLQLCIVVGFLVFLVILKQFLGDLHFQKTVGIFERFPEKNVIFQTVFNFI